MEFPLIVSFYTKNTLYQLEVQNLIASCEKWGLAHVVEAVPSFGSWELNCAYKPFFLLEKLKQFKRPLLWVDADGVFENNPSTSVFWDSVGNVDLSVRMDLKAAWDCPSKVITSTIMVLPTETGEQILRLWAKESERQFNDPERVFEFWDQIALRDVLLSHSFLDRVLPIPLAYAHIFDRTFEQDSHHIAPIIVHYQASRRLKKLIVPCR